jgi:hypothetical protein
MRLFSRVGTRWVYPAMGGPPIGLRWEAIYPLMDRLQLPPEDWDHLHEDLMVMEPAAIETMRANAPKPK